ncbi:hypothetical protein RhiJN_27278 [Ceratobasidium sp. AG-Ba]|nr:hypothetical protein RhiJN_27278 [Ceratobasidium sp. AG-Ba]
MRTPSEPSGAHEALYNTPQPQLRQQDLRLPSPHEILAQADWHRFSSSSERLTTEHARPTPPAFSPAPTHAFLYPDSHVPLPPLAKRKREPELDVSVRRPRHEPDQHHEVSGGRRGYLSMSALGVSDKPPERPRDFASPVPPTPRDERRYSALARTNGMWLGESWPPPPLMVIPLRRHETIR